MTYEQGSEIRPLASYVEQFIQERRFLKGVSPKTLEWYKYGFKAFAPVIDVPYESSTAFKAFRDDVDNENGKQSIEIPG